MPLENITIDEYVVHLYGGTAYQPIIFVTKADRSKSAYLYFMDGDELRGIVRGGPDRYTILMRRRDMEATIDILRNEKPIVLVVDADRDFASLRTSYEPVGEGEEV